MQTIKSVFLILGVTLALGLAIWNFMTSPKVAYVRSNYLLDEYTGMKEATDAYHEKQKKWQNTLDSLKHYIENETGKYIQDSVTLSKIQKAEKREHIGQLKTDFYRTSEHYNKLLQEEEEKISENVMKQMNQAIKVYGKKHGFDIILGTLETGNVVYGNESLDVTDQVLEYMNKIFSGEE
jgi:outer membrane protein